MKTLNEVIIALEYCLKHDQMGNCNGDCPYIHCCDPESVAIKKDALHYLNEYRETKKHLACLDAAEIRGEDTQVVNNPPLTLDELKTMEGKPVWIEWISGTWKGLRKWVISHGCDDLMMVFTALDVAGVSYDGHLRQMNLGKTWQAYRKEHGTDS